MAVIGEGRIAVLKRKLGAGSRTVRLSQWTAGKQRLNHLDIEPEHFRLVQLVIDEGEFSSSVPATQLVPSMPTESLGTPSPRSSWTIQRLSSSPFTGSIRKDLFAHVKCPECLMDSRVPCGPPTPRSPEGMRVSRMLPAPALCRLQSEHTARPAAADVEADA